MDRPNETTPRDRSPGVSWLLSSTLVVAGVGLWGTLLGLLYRLGWLSAFGVSQDLFLPSSATELTYWGYVALLQGWVALKQGLYAFVLWIAGAALGGLALGLLIRLILVKYKAQLDKLKQHKASEVSMPTLAAVALVVLYPLGIFAAATVVLLAPFPAYSLGKHSAEAAIGKYRSEVAAGSRSCHQLVGPAGNVGACPMVIAQTTERIAFLDGNEVHLMPSDGLTVRWLIRPTVIKVPDVASGHPSAPAQGTAK